MKIWSLHLLSSKASRARAYIALRYPDLDIVQQINRCYAQLHPHDYLDHIYLIYYFINLHYDSPVRDELGLSYTDLG